MNCLLEDNKPTIIHQPSNSNSLELTSDSASNSNNINNNNNNITAACNSKIIANNLNGNANLINQSAAINIQSHHHANNNSNNLSNSNSNSQESCLICGDVASGKHYGLRSCEACKAFFKRTVQGKIEYSCPATRECEINKRRRKACQACRFQKCLNMGMLKEGVRLDRVRGGRQKYRRGLSPSPTNGPQSNATSINNVHSNNHSSSLNSFSNLDDAHLSGSNISGLGCVNNNNINSNINSGSGSNNNHGKNNSQLNNCQQQSSNTINNLSETKRIITALINCEPEELSASTAQIPLNLSTHMRTLYILSDLFDRELVSLIGWAKQIPGFSETITLNDQMRLLQSTWAEVIALSIGYRSHNRHQQNEFNTNSSNINNINFMTTITTTTTPSPTSSSPASTASSYNNHNGNLSSSSSTSYNLDNSEIRLVFAKDLIIDLKHAMACGAEDIFYNCVQLIKRLDYLKITPKEYIILKAISLANADVRLENPKATHRLRELMMETLYEVTMSEYNGSNINHRLNQVLLCLPVLRQIDSCIRKFWNDVRKGPNNVPMNKLFEEMLEPCQRVYKSSAEM